MSIMDSFYKDSRPMIKIKDVYPVSDVKFDAFIVTFSKRIIEALQEDNLIELISQDGITSISCDYPVYRFKKTNIGLIKTTVGAPITSVLIEEMAHIYSCKKAIMFGTCGSLDRNIPVNKIIVPTHAYRDEGVSYHYMEPSDYIEIPNAKRIIEIFAEIKVDFVVGRTWTTDAFYRETEAELIKRRSEGCIAVEMEISACQAVANNANIEFYPFLYRADNIDASSWEDAGTDKILTKDDRLKILSLALELAKRV